jgi:hypothetical protein
MRSSPESGFSAPVIILNSVVLPAPLGPMTPTMPALGSENDRSSMSSSSPKPLLRSLASITTSPRRLPEGMKISSSPDAVAAALDSASSSS